MARSLIVPVVTVRNARPHPNADKLDLVEVLGYQMVTGKGRWQDGMLAVYFPADTVLPDEWVDKFNVRPYVGSGNRIKRARLRGEPSFGLIVEPADPSWQEGQNVADHYGATQYRPPLRQGNDAVGFAPYDNEIDPLFDKYTDIEDGRLLYDKFLPGEEVVVSEKIHGRNCRVGIVDGQVVAGSMTARRERPADVGSDMFWGPWADARVEALLTDLARAYKVVILYGEVYGPGVQSMNYGVRDGRGFRAFDICVDGRYLDFDGFARACDMHGVPRVPVLYRGPFDLAAVKGLANGQTTLGGDHIREGVVVRTSTERRDPTIGRMVLKIIGDEFDLSKHKEKEAVDA